MNIWKSPAVEAGAWFHRLEKTHRGRFKLGVGHREGIRRRDRVKVAAVSRGRAS